MIGPGKRINCRFIGSALDSESDGRLRVNCRFIGSALDSVSDGRTRKTILLRVNCQFIRPVLDLSPVQLPVYWTGITF
jgi:hypothetical protein